MTKPRYSRVAFCGVIGILCSAMTTSLGQSVLVAQEPPQAESRVMTTTTPTTEAAPKIPNDQLDSLVAPIALYPDPLLSQTLVASTYPLEIIQLEQWLKSNPNLKDKALSDAVEKQSWDPSIQAMATFPEVLNRLAQNVAWTTDLGNAFLAQQSDVMVAVQRMRAKAQTKGTLKTSAEQVVKTEAAEGQEIIFIEQANPEVVYIPSYDPMVIYGPISYPYYPYYYPGYLPGMGLAFGTGLVLGAAWRNGWGWGCGWGHGDVNVNVNNKYVNHYNKQNNIGNAGNRWQHNPQHRGGAPYGDRATANKYGGRARQQTIGATGANRPGSVGGYGPGGRMGGSNIGAGDRRGAGNIGAGNRASGGIGGANVAGVGRPGGGAGLGGGGAGARPGTGVSTMPATRPGGGSGSFGGNSGMGGSNHIGTRDVSSSGGGGVVFGGGGYSARTSSSRGSYSMGGGGFGGGGRGGGGGGGRGGGRR